MLEIASARSFCKDYKDSLKQLFSMGTLKFLLIILTASLTFLPMPTVVSQQMTQYARITDITWIPPNNYEITVAARWLPCLCIEHKVTLEGGYALDWPEIQVIKVIASWTVPVGQSLKAKAVWTCPREGRYKLIVTASHDLRDEFTSFFVPEFPYPTIVLLTGTLLATITARKKGNRRIRAT